MLRLITLVAFLFNFTFCYADSFNALTVRYQVTGLEGQYYTSYESACAAAGFSAVSPYPNIQAHFFCYNSGGGVVDTGIWLWPENVATYCPSNATLNGSTCTCNSGFVQNTFSGTISCTSQKTLTSLRTKLAALGAVGLTALVSTIGCLASIVISCALALSTAVTAAGIYFFSLGNNSTAATNAPNSQPLIVSLVPSQNSSVPTTTPSIQRDSSGNLTVAGAGWVKSGTVSTLVTQDQSIKQETTVDESEDLAKIVTTNNVSNKISTVYVSGSGGAVNADSTDPINPGPAIYTSVKDNSNNSVDVYMSQLDPDGNVVTQYHSTSSDGVSYTDGYSGSASSSGSTGGTTSDSSGSSSSTTGGSSSSGSSSGTGGNGDCVSFGCATEATLKKIYDFFTGSSTQTLSDPTDQLPTDVFSPVSSSVDSFLNFTVTSHSSQCPTWHRVISIQQRTVNIDFEAHCALIEEHRSFINTVAMLGWSILAVLIILGA